jgi:hypothetical protein
VPLVSKEYYKEYKVTIDPAMRAGFLSALCAFTEETFAEELESFTMKNFKIVLQSRVMRESPPVHIFTYCIGDKKIKIKPALKALTRVLDEFTKKYSYLKSFTGDLEIYEKFEEVIDSILGDLAKKPTDRLRTLLK